MGHNKKSKIKIEYPTWKMRGSPTPNEFLSICDTCGSAVWTVPVNNYQKHYICRTCKTRKREATQSEYEEARSCLKEII